MADNVNQDNPQVPPQEQEPTYNVNTYNIQAPTQQLGVTKSKRGDNNNIRNNK